MYWRFTSDPATQSVHWSAWTRRRNNSSPNRGISRTLRAVHSSFEERIIKWENTQPLREPSLSKRILPLIPAGLVINQILPSADEISMMASSCQEAPHCPSCAQASQRIHSHYQRRLCDLPSQGRPVTLRVQVRRFRCLNPTCSRQTFAEPLPSTARRRARRTERLGDLQRHLGLALGGEAGMRLAERLAIPVSADALLRLAREASNDNEPPSTPRVLAVDDWSSVVAWIPLSA